MENPIPELFGRCKVEKRLGEGAVGTVYLAEHQALGIPVAVKVVPVRLLESRGQSSERFMREARMAARIRHPNVLRVYDCKNEGCRAVVAELPTVADYLCGPCAEHFAAVKGALEAAGIDYEQDEGLVRGLDYYTRTVYEFKHSGIGARDAVGGGGRYDGLVEQLGGPATPCVGFALGVEPTLLAMESELGSPAEEAGGPSVYIVCFDAEARGAVFQLARELRAAGVATDLDFQGRSGKSQMRTANRLGAPICLLMGGNELAEGVVTVKRMADGRQWSEPRADAVRTIAALCADGGNTVGDGD